MTLTTPADLDVRTGRPEWPLVTVAIPMLNERDHIENCLDGFAAQAWPMRRLDVMVIDGGSADGSREFVERYMRRNPWVRLIDNERGSAAAAFNLGMIEGRGDVVCLFSAHGVADKHYVRRSVEALHRSGAAGVGGDYRHEGQDPSSRAIGRAMVSPVGMGSPHRFATTARDVDTISHPAYWRDAMIETGPFDEGLARNSDYEFNHRMREAGYRLHFDPAIGSVYRPRPTLAALARQFWHYGRWKFRVVERHPRSVRPRHLVAPLAVIGALGTPVAMGFRSLRRVVAAVWLAYAVVVGIGVFLARPRAHGGSIPKFVFAIPIMHASWGAGFLTSALSRLLERKSS